MTLREGSLCTGYNGLGLAAEAVLGCELAWCSEIEPAPASLLERRYPHAPNLGDLTSIDWTDVEPVDVLTAGYPCQPFSQAGKRGGDTDERHLWPHIATTVIGALRPPTVVLENVAGHLSLGFDQVLADLDGLGYDAEWSLLRAADVGACHGRARLFVVARDRAAGASSPVDGTAVAVVDHGALVSTQATLFDAADLTLPKAGSLRSGEVRQRPLLTESFATPVGGSLLPTPVVLDAAGVRNRTANRSDPTKKVAFGDTLTDAMWQTFRPDLAAAGRLLPTPTANLGDNGGSQHPDKRRDGNHQPSIQDVAEHVLLPTPRASDMNRPGVHGNGGQDLRTVVDRDLLPTPTARDHKDGAGTTWHPEKRKLPHTVGAEVGEGGSSPRWGIYETAVRRHEHAFGRAVPLPVDAKGRLAPRFVEWMMCLADGWVTDLIEHRGTALKMLGNGVVPPQAAHAMAGLLARHQAEA